MLKRDYVGPILQWYLGSAEGMEGGSVTEEGLRVWISGLGFKVLPKILNPALVCLTGGQGSTWKIMCLTFSRNEHTLNSETLSPMDVGQNRGHQYRTQYTNSPYSSGPQRARLFLGNPKP